MPAHVSCTPWSYDGVREPGCFVVCPQHDLRRAFGAAHAAAHAACVEHNRVHHADRGGGAAALLSIIYESSAVVPFEAAELDRLLAQAETKNRASGVTGMLLTEGGWFLQALEGPAPAVESLLASIRRDARHARLRVLSRETRHERRFPDWAMVRGHVGEVEAQPLEQYYEALLLARGG